MPLFEDLANPANHAKLTVFSTLSVPDSSVIDFKELP